MKLWYCGRQRCLWELLKTGLQNSRQKPESGNAVTQFSTSKLILNRDSFPNLGLLEKALYLLSAVNFCSFQNLLMSAELGRHVLGPSFL